MRTTLSIGICHRAPITAEGLRSTLAELRPAKLIQLEGRTLLDPQAKPVSPRLDLLLLDWSLAGDAGDDWARIRAWVKRRAPCKLLLVVPDPCPGNLPAAAALGPDGCISEADTTGELLTAVRAVLAGKPYFSPQLAENARLGGRFGGPHFGCAVPPAERRNLMRRTMSANRLGGEQRFLQNSLHKGPARITNPLPQTAIDAIVGKSPPMRALRSLIEQVGPVDAPVLIGGETGTGKELVARAIHARSRRAAGPLVVVNCAAVAETLWEAEFFGHERGAFTGADERRIGRFEQADGGTLFLDEVGDTPPGVQATLLRVLDGNGFSRVGGNELLCPEVRVVAATSRDLGQSVERGEFRRDLYSRLSAFAVSLPALRERLDDLPLLAAHFLARHAAALDCQPPRIDDEALALLAQQAWPANLRDLSNCLFRMMVLCSARSLGAGDVGRVLPLSATVRDDESGAAAGAAVGPLAPPAAGDGGRDELVRFFERQLDSAPGGAAYACCIDGAVRTLLQVTLRRTSGNQSRAAALLGLSRPALRDKLRKLGLLPCPEPRP